MPATKAAAMAAVPYALGVIAHRHHVIVVSSFSEFVKIMSFHAFTTRSKSRFFEL